MGPLKRLLAAVLAAGIPLVLLAACGGEGGSATGDLGAPCTREALPTITPGRLVVAVGQPAYEPWVRNDKPEGGEGFEAAVAHAAAERLGFSAQDLRWVRTTADEALAPGPKPFDWSLQQHTITPVLEASVDFSAPYLALGHAVVTYEGSPIEDARAVADLADARIGAVTGSDGRQVAQRLAVADPDIAVFRDTAEAVAALSARTVDGLVLDLRTAFSVVAGQVDDGVIVGQVPASRGGTAEEIGILLGQDSPLTACTSRAVEALRADGTLERLAQVWLAERGGAPVLS